MTDITVNAKNEVRIAKSNAPEAVAERQRMYLETLARTDGNKAAAARELGFSEYTVYKWEAKDEDFKARVREVMAIRNRVRAGELEDVIHGLALGKSTKDGVPHFQAAKFLIEKYNPEEFGPPVVEHKHSGTVYHSLIERPKAIDELEVVPLEAEYEVLEDETDDH